MSIIQSNIVNNFLKKKLQFMIKILLQANEGFENLFTVLE